MKVKDLIFMLNALNPKREIEFRAYTNSKKEYIDLPIVEVRIGIKNDESKLIISNQMGVE